MRQRVDAAGCRHHPNLTCVLPANGGTKPVKTCVELEYLSGSTAKSIPPDQSLVCVQCDDSGQIPTTSTRARPT